MQKPRFEIQRRSNRKPEWTAVHACHQEANARAFLDSVIAHNAGRHARLGLAFRMVDTQA